MIRKSTKKKNGQWERRVAVYMGENLYEKLKKEAWLASMKESAYLRNLLVNHLESKK